MTACVASFNGIYRFLSNFWIEPVTRPGGETYKSAEHAYQAAKTVMKCDHDFVRDCPTPGQAKRAGRAFQCRDNWDARKNEIMLEIIRAKFQSGTTLAERLEATDDAELVEGNSWGDHYWGVCGGIGENWLGRILMQVRDENRTGRD